MYKHIVDNTCYISQGKGVTVLNSQSELQGHTKSPVMTAFYGPHKTNSIPLQLCLYLAPFSRYYHLFPKIYRRHVTWAR